VNPVAVESASAAVAVVVRHAGTLEAQVLLGRRAANPQDPWSGQIAFPGGHSEACDTDLLDTAIRELREESGLVLDRGALTGRLPLAHAGRLAGPGLPVQPWLFFCDPGTAPGGDGEIEAWDWIPLSLLDDPSARIPSPVAGHMGVRTSLGVLWGMTLATLESLWNRPLVEGIRRLMLDFDGTFYPRQHPLFDAIDERISLYVAQHEGLSHADGHERRKTLYQSHGNTLHGLMHEGLEDPEDFLRFVFDLPDSAFPGPSPELDRVFGRLGLPVDIFTNAQAAYVKRTLRLMELKTPIGAIHDLASFGYDCKPHGAVYDLVRSRHPEAPQEVLFVDDQPANCAVGRGKGYRSLLIREGFPDWRDAQFRIGSLTELPRFLLSRLGA